jgi:ParB family chromosome partitioning protein
MAGLDIIPVIVMELDDKQALEIALVENIQRRDLVATEIARGYQKLIDDFGYTQESLSEVVGKSRSQVTNTLRLLALPEGVQTLLDHDEISTGHARALLGAENAEEVALQVVKRGLNVRQTEKLVKKSSSFPRQQARTRHKVEAEKDPDILEIEKLISGALGMDVDIQNTGDKGAVTIGYQSLVELDRLLRLLEQPLETEAQQEVVSA